MCITVKLTSKAVLSHSSKNLTTDEIMQSALTFKHNFYYKSVFNFINMKKFISSQNYLLKIEVYEIPQNVCLSINNKYGRFQDFEFCYSINKRLLVSKTVK